MFLSGLPNPEKNIFLISFLFSSYKFHCAVVNHGYRIKSHACNKNTCNSSSPQVSDAYAQPKPVLKVHTC